MKVFFIPFCLVLSGLPFSQGIVDSNDLIDPFGSQLDRLENDSDELDTDNNDAPTIVPAIHRSPPMFPLNKGAIHPDDFFNPFAKPLETGSDEVICPTVAEPVIRPNQPLHNFNEEMLTSMLNTATFGDLIQIALDADATIRQRIIHEHLMPKYGIHEKTIMITGPMRSYNAATHIKIESGDVASNFLSVLGDRVTKLVFDGADFDDDLSLEISKQIARFCRNLVEIELVDAGNYLVSDTSETFPRVVKAHFQLPGNSEFFQFHRIYPAVRELTLALDQSVSPTSDSSLQKLGELFTNIQQLESLTLSGVASNRLLQSIEKNLPALEELHIMYDTNEAMLGSVHFSNVKTFSVMMISGDKGISYDPSPVTFDRLENLTIYAMDFSNVPLRLIEDSRNLKVFSLPWMKDEYGVDYVVDMLRQKKQLKEVTINWSPERSLDNAVSLITSFDAVEKITFVTWEVVSVDQVDSFISSIPFEWHVVGSSYGFGSHSRYLTIAKKVKSNEKSKRFNPNSKYWLGNNDRARYEDDVRA